MQYEQKLTSAGAQAWRHRSACRLQAAARLRRARVGYREVWGGVSVTV